ncbi:MAG: glycosyltransferase [Candidatus Thiodiazotropha sp.]|jgi:glycosyltransferase involved in cell wall biosynthesis
MTRVCIFITTFGDGGVERMLVNLARGLSQLGIAVDFIVKTRQAPYLDRLPEQVRLIEFGSGNRKQRQRQLLTYVDETQPDVMISAKGKDDLIAMRVKHLTKAETRFFLRPGTAVSERLRARNANWFKRWRTHRRMRWLYAQTDGVIAVSNGVAEEIIGATGVAANKVKVVRNPNITPELYDLAAAPLDHPWFTEGEDPVLLGIGGLRLQKDFPSLLRAFALVNDKRPCRLMILGQGHLHDELSALAESLGISDRVALPGFVDNPYAYLARADLFVLSSLWEGSPNVLTESLALGTPVVATDCKSGPNEITQQGKFGHLVAVGDVQALAAAILDTLANPPASDWLKSAVQEYTMEKSAISYLKALGLPLPLNEPDNSQTDGEHV